MPRKTKSSRTRPTQKRRSLLPSRPNTKVKTWLLVVDGAKAQVYDVAAETCRLKAVPDGTFKQANAPSHALASDRPGRGSHAGSQRRHAIAKRSDPHNKAETNFVKDVAKHINGAARLKQFDRLIVAAPPKAMSELRAVVNAIVKRKIALEITHEWTKLGVRDMADRLKAALRPLA